MRQRAKPPKLLVLGVLNASAEGSERIQRQTMNPANSKGRCGAPGCLPATVAEPRDGAAPSLGVQVTHHSQRVSVLQAEPTAQKH